MTATLLSRWYCHVTTYLIKYKKRCNFKEKISTDYYFILSDIESMHLFKYWPTAWYLCFALTCQAFAITCFLLVPHCTVNSGALSKHVLLSQSPRSYLPPGWSERRTLTTRKSTSSSERRTWIKTRRLTPGYRGLPESVRYAAHLRTRTSVEI